MDLLQPIEQRRKIFSMTAAGRDPSRLSRLSSVSPSTSAITM